MTTVEKIKVGDKVRSFDFDSRDIKGNDACYVEGVAESIEGHPMGGGGKYVKFKITRKVFSGKERFEQIGEYNWAPQNGQKSWKGITNHLTIIA